MINKKTSYFALATKIAEEFKLDSVEAIAIGGSQSNQLVDKHSDIDLYIYSTAIIPVSKRKSIVSKLGASRADLILTFWDDGDEWIDAGSGMEIDVIYWKTAWIEEQINKVLINHEASVGYSTCFWHTVANSEILFDRNGWFTSLQKKCSQPYPEQLQKAIIAKNHPILRNVIPSYYNQIEKAIDRKNLISINHRVAALLASYFDVLFALNSLTNPGEKKLMKIALETCKKLPLDMQADIEAVLESVSSVNELLLNKIDTLLDNLDDLLLRSGINW